MDSDQLLNQLQLTINSLVGATKELSSRINSDIKDIYKQLGKLREDVVRIETNDITDKDLGAKLEKSLEALKSTVDKMSVIMLSEDELRVMRESIAQMKEFIASENARREEGEVREKKLFRSNILKLLGSAALGGGGVAGITQLIRFLIDSGLL